ncbi:hypothetical protein ACJJTC_004576 [Scirpophaga incertulas]
MGRSNTTLGTTALEGMPLATLEYHGPKLLFAPLFENTFPNAGGKKKLVEKPQGHSPDRTLPVVRNSATPIKNQNPGTPPKPGGFPQNGKFGPPILRKPPHFRNCKFPKRVFLIGVERSDDFLVRPGYGGGGF